MLKVLTITQCGPEDMKTFDRERLTGQRQ
jgi:hypothetical protein